MDARLLPKIHVNLGITQEADGRLLAACDNYRRAFVLLRPTHGSTQPLGTLL